MSLQTAIRWGLGALGTLAIGVALYGLIASLDTLHCQRDTGSCTLTHAKPFSLETREIRLDTLAGADVRPLSGGTKRSTAAFIALLTTSNEVIPLIAGTDQGKDTMQQHVETIERFLKTPLERTLDVRWDYRVVPALVSAIPFAMWLLMLVVARVTGAKARQSPAVVEAR